MLVPYPMNIDELQHHHGQRCINHMYYIYILCIILYLYYVCISFLKEPFHQTLGETVPDSTGNGTGHFWSGAVLSDNPGSLVEVFHFLTE